jgi:hypothetical protein
VELIADPLGKSAARSIAAAALSLIALTAAPAVKPSHLSMEFLGSDSAVHFESGFGEGRNGWREVAHGIATCLRQAWNWRQPAAVARLGLVDALSPLEPRGFAKG